MVQTGNVVLAVVAILSALFRGYVKPKIDEIGFFRKIVNHNNERCSRVEGLEACEDIFVDRKSGLAYLGCSDRLSRSYWTPAMNLLQRDKISFPTKDYIAILNIKTSEYRKIELLNLPPHLIKNGIHPHGIDVFVQPTEDDSTEDDHGQLRFSSKDDFSSRGRRATIFLINHNPPEDLSSAPIAGANSVIEVFDTVLGDLKATHRTTIENELVYTPNNIVALDENSFYVTNDHSKKIYWKRHLEPILTDSELDSISYCSFKNGKSDCKVAWHGKRPFPNGIARGPGKSLYMVTTFNPWLQVFEIQPDHILSLKDELKLRRMTDNIHVTPSGSIFLTAFPKGLKFLRMIRDYRLDRNLSSPTEVWKVTNSTGENAKAGRKLQIEKVFSDDSRQVSGGTAAGVYGSKLIITGLSSPWVSICELDEDLTT